MDEQTQPIQTKSKDLDRIINRLDELLLIQRLSQDDQRAGLEMI